MKLEGMARFTGLFLAPLESLTLSNIFMEVLAFYKKKFGSVVKYFFLEIIQSNLNIFKTIQNYPKYEEREKLLNKTNI